MYCCWTNRTAGALISVGTTTTTEAGTDASVEEMFYTSFVDTKAEGLLTISSPWQIPNLSNYFEVVNENEVLVKPGIYEITLDDNAHGGHFYL